MFIVLSAVYSMIITRVILSSRRKSEKYHVRIL